MLIYFSAGAVRGGYSTACRKHVHSGVLHRLQHLPCYEITCNCGFNLPSSATVFIYWPLWCRILHFNEHLSNNFHSSESTPERAQHGLITTRELPLYQFENIPIEEGDHVAEQRFASLRLDQALPSRKSGGSLVFGL